MANYFDKPKQAGTPTWTDLQADDQEAARKFYHAVFGWDYDIGGAEFGGYATAKAGKYPVAGIGGKAPGAPPSPTRWTLYFASDDAAKDLERATALGGKVEWPAMEIGPFGSMAVGVDPTGAPFGLWQAGQHIGWQVQDDFNAATWWELYTPDAKKARDFYKSLLGLSVEPVPGMAEYYVMTRGEKQLGGIMQIDPSWGNMQPMWVTYFSVKNADETVATIKKNGGKQMGNVDDSPFGRLAAVADPQGGLFKVIEPPKQ
jgi:predicted enzyme related to lactoylglutathione lyase